MGGRANKPKTLKTRLGDIPFAVPQVRGEVEFYPSALEKGIRSEPALKLALAEPSGAKIAKGRSLCPKGSAGGRWQMYVQGVSTRKVTTILEELCGTSVSSTHTTSLMRT